MKPAASFASPSHLTPLNLDKVWFGDVADDLRRAVRAEAKAAKMPIELHFLDDGDHSDGDGLIALALGEILVSYRPRYRTFATKRERKEYALPLVRRRARELARIADTLTKRYQQVTKAASRTIERVGLGAKLVSVVLEPVDLNWNDPPLGQRYFEVRFTILDDNLDAAMDGVLTRTSRHASRVLAQRLANQAVRHQAMDERRQHPGQIKVDTMALLLRELAGLPSPESSDELFALPARFTVGGVEHHSVCVFVRNGSIQCHFWFEAGYYHSGDLFLYEELPLSVQQACVGRPVQQLIQGGVFDHVNPTIAGIGDTEQATRFHLEQSCTWMPMS